MSLSSESNSEATHPTNGIIGPLPIDLWTHICKEYLPAPTVLSAAVSCRGLNYLLLSNLVWKSLVEAEFVWNEGHEDKEFAKNLDQPGQYRKTYRHLLEMRQLIVLPQDTRLQEYDFQCKMLLTGDSGVGKSSLALRFARDEFTDSFISTIGVDFVLRCVKTREGNSVGANLAGRLQIWDTGSSRQRFVTITSAYYRGTHAVMIVFDITDRDSYDHTVQWYDNVVRYANRETTVVMLVGTKADLESKRQVSRAEAQQRAKDEFGNAFYFETSSKTNSNVTEMFCFATNKVLELHPNRALDLASAGRKANTGGVAIQQQNKSSRSVCNIQ